MKSPYYKLSRNEIEYIKKDVEKSELSVTHLEEELIDHLCCVVEEYISEGYTFEKALARVRNEVGIETLKEIEIQTVLSINKKLYAMKNTIKISGIIGLTAIVISSLFKVMHWPGAAILLTFGFVTFMLAYLPALALTLKKEKILKSKMQLSYVGIATAFILLLSLLFSIMQWPYNDYLRIFSWAMILIFLFMLFRNIMKTEENRILNFSILLLLALLFVINITFRLLEINNPRLKEVILENNFKQSIDLFDHKTALLYQQLDTMEDNTIASEIAELKTYTEQVIAKVEEIRDGVFSSQSEQENFNKKIIKDNSITNELEYKVYDLSYKILPTYRSFILEKSNAQTQLSSFIECSIQFGNFEFNNNPQVIYNNLQKLIRDIKIVESELLSSMQLSK